ncbi:unnamed protein product, partial [Rangifer tarandus platyrhynchus]
FPFCLAPHGAEVLLVRKTQEAGLYRQSGPVEELCPSCSPTQGWQYIRSPGTETGAVFPTEATLSRFLVPILLLIGWIVGCIVMVYVVFS